MSERAAELWEPGQELDGSAEDLLAELREKNAERDWDRQAICRRIVGDEGTETSDQSSDD